MHFDSILGHNQQKKILLKSKKENRVSHAYLFCGVEGIGKKLAAIEFAKTLNCLNLNENEQKKCECTSCKKIEKLIHPDVLVYEYTKEKNIKVDQIRDDIEQKIYLRPYEGNYKVFILDDAERMNVNAQNAFLKTLEEPPQYSVLILITSTPDILLPTIRSRCQTINFNPLPDELIQNELKKNSELNSDDIKIASQISNGSLGKALKITKESLEKRNEVIEKITNINQKNPSEISNLLESLNIDARNEETDGLKEFFHFISLWLRDLITLKTSSEKEKIINSDLISESEEFASTRTLETITEKTICLEQTWYAISRLNANKKLALENLFLKLSQ